MGGPAWTIPTVALPDWLVAQRQQRTARYVGAAEKFDIPAAVRADFEQVLAEREEARQTRNEINAQPRPLEEHDSRELSTTRYEVNESSRELGDMAGQAFIDRNFPGAESIYPPPGAPSRSGDFDQVWKATDANGNTVWVVIEAKGGSSDLGGRTLADGTFAQQGSAAYFDRIIEVMSQSPDGARVADDLAAARVWDAVRYFEVRAPLGEQAGQTVLKPLESREFDLSRPPQ